MVIAIALVVVLAAVVMIRQGRRPNVVLITLDTVAAEHMSLYGYARDTTPTLREFAREATTYNMAISPGNMTLTSHASLFTGLYASGHGAYRDADLEIGVLPGDVPMLAEVLQTNGYDTAAAIANVGYLSPSFGFKRGFNHYDARPRRAAELTGDAFKRLEVWRERQLPFFLFINYLDAHRPYLPPPPFDRMFPGKIDAFSWNQYEEVRRAAAAGERVVSDVERQHLVSQYDGVLVYLDRQLGRLFRQLRLLDLYDDTLIVITSDHGEEFGDRNLLGHGLSVYQREIRVPLLLKLPSRSWGQGPQDGSTRQGTVVGEPVSLVDVMPTVLDALGLGPTRPGHGQSLLGGPSTPSSSSGAARPVVSEAFPSEFARKDGYHLFSQRAIFDGSMKLIVFSDGRRELYDLASDPSERHNLFRNGDRRAQILEAALTRYVSEMDRERRNARAKGQPLDPETMERLKTLGYVQ